MPRFTFTPRSQDDLLEIVTTALIEGQTIQELCLDSLFDMQQEIEYDNAYDAEYAKVDPEMGVAGVEAQCNAAATAFVEEWRIALDNDPEKLVVWVTAQLSVAIDTDTLDLHRFDYEDQQGRFDAAACEAADTRRDQEWEGS